MSGENERNRHRRGGLPVVAVVGAPNVGKSSFVNRVLGRRSAVVADEPGTTRDRSYSQAEWAGRDFTLVDTGGMEPAAKVGLQALVTLQAKVAVEEADVILHIADSRLGGPTEADSAIARELRKARGKVILAVNKLDNPADDAERHQFHSLGEGEPHAISASHGIGFGDLLDEIAALLPEAGGEEGPDLPRVAIIGRPNVGKSTLLNRLIGSERAVVSEVAGTTTDAVENEVEVDGEVERYLLLDTAGVNRSARRASGVPYYSSLRTAEAVRRSDVSLLMLDAVDGIVSGDLQLARQIEEAGRSCGVVINKSDLVSTDDIRDIEEKVSYRMTDLKPEFISISALSGEGVGKVMPFAAKVHRAYETRVSTHEVAEFINRVVQKSAPAKGVKIRYATQTGARPPRFTLFANRPEDLRDNYLRYVENELRSRYGLRGVSLRIRVKSSR